MTGLEIRLTDFSAHESDDEHGILNAVQEIGDAFDPAVAQQMQEAEDRRQARRIKFGKMVRKQKKRRDMTEWDWERELGTLICVHCDLRRREKAIDFDIQSIREGLPNPDAMKSLVGLYSELRSVQERMARNEKDQKDAHAEISWIRSSVRQEAGVWHLTGGKGGLAPRYVFTPDRP
jgi:hypothetical protein